VAEVGNPLVDDQVGEAEAGVPRRIVGGERRVAGGGVGVVLDALAITRGVESGGLNPLIGTDPLGRRVSEVILGDHVLRMQPGRFDEQGTHRQRLGGRDTRKVQAQRISISRRVEAGVVEFLEVELLDVRR
jgi:hypothetical protein